MIKTRRRTTGDGTWVDHEATMSVKKNDRLAQATFYSDIYVRSESGRATGTISEAASIRQARAGVQKQLLHYVDENTPGVVCQCGSESFTLRYGNYEIFAKCVKCGLEGSVHSG